MNERGSEPGALAALLRYLRIRAGLSPDQLARRARVSRSTLWRIEDGATARPSQDTLSALATALRVSESLLQEALWLDQDGPLPTPATYFRTQFNLTEDEIASLTRSLEEGAAEKGAHDDHPRPDQRGPAS